MRIIIFCIFAALILSLGGTELLIKGLFSNFIFLIISLYVSILLCKKEIIYKSNKFWIFTILYVIGINLLIVLGDSKDKYVLIPIEISFIILGILGYVYLKLKHRNAIMNKNLMNISYQINRALSLFCISILIERIFAIFPLTRNLYFDMIHIFLVMVAWYIFNTVILSNRLFDANGD